jgi:hypothetical protein
MSRKMGFQLSRLHSARVLWVFQARCNHRNLFSVYSLLMYRSRFSCLGRLLLGARDFDADFLLYERCLSSKMVTHSGACKTGDCGFPRLLASNKSPSRCLATRVAAKPPPLRFDLPPNPFPFTRLRDEELLVAVISFPSFSVNLSFGHFFLRPVLTNSTNFYKLQRQSLVTVYIHKYAVPRSLNGTQLDKAQNI